MNNRGNLKTWIRLNQKIFIGETEVTVIEATSNKARLHILASKDLDIRKGETPVDISELKERTHE